MNRLKVVTGLGLFTVGLFIFILLFTSQFSLFTIHAQTQCVTNSTGNARATNGLVSTQNQNLSSSKFGNDTNNCVNGQQAALPTFDLQTYPQLKSLYYDQLKIGGGNVKNAPVSSATEANLNSWLQTSQSSSYVTGDVNINGAINSGDNGTGVIFVDGNLNIHQNVVYHSSDANGGLVFVVQGAASIDTAVTQVDAVIIAFGNNNNWAICTAYDSSAGCPAPPLGYTNPNTTSPLTVNGSLIDLNPAKPIIFRRNLLNNRIAAELVNQKPKYNVILRNLFSQTLTITTQGTNYADNGVGYYPSIRMNVSANPNPAVTGQSVTWTISNVTGGDGIYSTPTWTSSDGSLNGKSGYSVSAVYNNAGSVTATATISDTIPNTGNQSSTLIVNPPSPTLTVNPNPACGVNANPACSTTPTVSWTYAPSPSSSDMLALYSAGASSNAWISDMSVSGCNGGGTTNGSCSFSIPSYIPSGAYEIRYVDSGFNTKISTPLTVNN